MNIPNLLITTPHGKCDMLSPHRACDLAAALAGQVFCSVADSYGFKYTYFPGDEFRVNHDLNRKPSRSTSYRKRLTSFLTSTRDSECLLFDIHSFPNYYMKEAGDVNFFRQGEIAPDIVILEGPSNTWRNIPLAQIIYETLHNAGFRTKIIRGIAVNDILTHAGEHSIPGVLLEYNERFNRDPKTLKKICSVVINRIKIIK